MDDGSLVLVRHKLTVDDYYKMADAGILGEDDRVELIDGEIIDMAPIGSDHIASVNRLTLALVVACGTKAMVSVQNPVRFDTGNELQPDFAVLRLRDDDYRRGDRAGPGDTLLLVEVADSSLRYDRAVKLPLYARAGVPEVWIVDLVRRVLHAHRDPDGKEYRTVSTHRDDERLALAAAPDIVVTLHRVFD